MTFRSTSLTAKEMGPPVGGEAAHVAAGTTASNWTPVAGTGLGRVTLKGMSKNAGNPPGNGSGNGSRMTGHRVRVARDAVVAVGAGNRDLTMATRPVEDRRRPRRICDTPVVSMNIAASPVIWVRPRLSACCATLWGIENCVWRPDSWNCCPWVSVDGVIVAVVVVSLSTRSPTGLPGQYSS